MAELTRQRKLMQNCDLPPPAKLFSCYIDNPIYADHPNNNPEDGNVCKALRLSERRAREAERRMHEASKERDCALIVLVSESMRVMAYRRWVTMLEIQVGMLRLETGEDEEWLRGRVTAEEDDDCDGGGVEKWKVGFLIVCGVAGLGIAYKLGLSMIRF